MIYSHYKDVPWNDDRWPNFSPDEKQLHCRCCGSFYLDLNSFDALQAARNVVGKPFHILSGHRCPLHNALVSGAYYSQHLRIAFDISTKGHDREELFNALKNAGFTGFGFYRGFIHADMGRVRKWYGPGGYRVWKDIKH